MIRTILKDLPSGVDGFTLEDDAGDYTVFLNSRQTYEMNKATFRHEIHHIRKKHFHHLETASQIEEKNKLSRIT